MAKERMAPREITEDCTFDGVLRRLKEKLDSGQTRKLTDKDHDIIRELTEMGGFAHFMVRKGDDI